MSSRVLSAFDNPSYPARPYRRIDGRWVRPDDWYEYLQVTPEEVAEQCRAHGYDEGDIQEILRSWGTRLYRGANKSRQPRAEENLRDAYAQDIPNLEAINRYDVEVEKPASADVFRNCRLQSDARPETIREYDKFKCQEILCNDDVPDLRGVMRRRKVRVPGQMAEVVAANPSNERIYRHCQLVGETHCKSSRNVELTVDAGTVTHVPNPGIGDCLFIAVSHYEYMASQLPGGNYITPDSAEARLVPESSISSATYFENGSYRTGEGKAVVDGRQKKLRAQVVEWFKINADRPYPSSANFGMTIRDELARVSIDADLAGRNFGFKMGLRSFNAKYEKEKVQLESAHGMELDTVCALSIVQSDIMTKQYREARHKLLDSIFNAYINHMSKQTTYGGEPEIMALSKILDKNIYIMQLRADRNFTSNLGFVEGERDNIYILHKQDVSGRGSEHYEVIFPVTADKFKNADGYALSNILVGLGGPVRKVGQSMNIYLREAGKYLSSLKGDEINITAIGLVESMPLLTEREKSVVIVWFSDHFVPYIHENADLKAIWNDIIPTINNPDLKRVLSRAAGPGPSTGPSTATSTGKDLKSSELVKRIISADISIFDKKRTRITEYIYDTIVLYNTKAVASKRVAFRPVVFGTQEYEDNAKFNLASMHTVAEVLGAARLEEKIKLREAIRCIILSWIVDNQSALEQEGIVVHPREAELTLVSLLDTLSKIMEAFDI